MPIINFTIRSQDLDNNDTALGGSSHAKKTIRFERGFKMRYLKLLHIFTNINNTNISDNEGQSDNTILFVKISFLNGQNCVYYETVNNTVIEHPGLICIGETVKESNQSTFKDMYKVLHDGKDLLYINQPFTVSFYKLIAKDSPDNADLGVYQATGSHTIQPITQDELRGGMDSGGQYISFTFEYQEDNKK